VVDWAGNPSVFERT